MTDEGFALTPWAAAAAEVAVAAAAAARCAATDVGATTTAAAAAAAAAADTAVNADDVDWFGLMPGGATPPGSTTLAGDTTEVKRDGLSGKGTGLWAGTPSKSMAKKGSSGTVARKGAET